MSGSVGESCKVFKSLLSQMTPRLPLLEFHFLCLRIHNNMSPLQICISEALRESAGKRRLWEQQNGLG